MFSTQILPTPEWRLVLTTAAVGEATRTADLAASTFATTTANRTETTARPSRPDLDVAAFQVSMGVNEAVLFMLTF
jgi:hypothetical protein